MIYFVTFPLSGYWNFWKEDVYMYYSLLGWVVKFFEWGTNSNFKNWVASTLGYSQGPDPKFALETPWGVHQVHHVTILRKKRVPDSVELDPTGWWWFGSVVRTFVLFHIPPLTCFSFANLTWAVFVCCAQLISNCLLPGQWPSAIICHSAQSSWQRRASTDILFSGYPPDFIQPIWKYPSRSFSPSSSPSPFLR